MPMWGEYWGPPWGGIGWIFPLVGLLFMVVMVFVCLRMICGMMAGGCMTGRRSNNPDEVEGLRREVRELKGEIEKLRHGS